MEKKNKEMTLKFEEKNDWAIVTHLMDYARTTNENEIFAPSVFRDFSRHTNQWEVIVQQSFAAFRVVSIALQRNRQDTHTEKNNFETLCVELFNSATQRENIRSAVTEGDLLFLSLAYFFCRNFFPFYGRLFIVRPAFFFSILCVFR